MPPLPPPCRARAAAGPRPQSTRARARRLPKSRDQRSRSSRQDGKGRNESALQCSSTPLRHPSRSEMRCEGRREVEGEIPTFVCDSNLSASCYSLLPIVRESGCPPSHLQFPGSSVRPSVRLSVRPHCGTESQSLSQERTTERTCRFTRNPSL